MCLVLATGSDQQVSDSGVDTSCIEDGYFFLDRLVL